MRQKEIEFQIKRLKAYNKVEDCIRSCKTVDQLLTCRQLIENFAKLFPATKKSIYKTDKTRLTEYLNRYLRPYEIVA